MKPLLIIVLLFVTVAAQCTGLAVDRQVEEFLGQQGREIDPLPAAPVTELPDVADVVIACPFLDGEIIFSELEILARDRASGISVAEARELLLLSIDCNSQDDRRCDTCIDTMIAFALPGAAAPIEPSDSVNARPQDGAELPLNVAVACLAVNQDQVPDLLQGIFDAHDEGVGKDETRLFLSISCGAEASCQRCIAEMVEFVYRKDEAG